METLPWVNQTPQTTSLPRKKKHMKTSPYETRSILSHRALYGPQIMELSMSSYGPTQILRDCVDCTPTPTPPQ